MNCHIFTSIFFTGFQVLWYLNEGALLHHPDADLTVQQIIKKYGYPIDDHYIVTEDGYILNFQRIPFGKTSYDGTRKPVILMHGLLSSSESYILSGPDKAFGYKLADQGYDVWLANARGNMHSRNHTKYNPDVHRKFWEFSYHEIGVSDIPAAIDYILNLTKQENLYYIGHSQGTTALVIMLAERPKYNKKIIGAALLAPPIFIKGMTNPFLPPVAMFHYTIHDMLNLLNINELIPNIQILQAIGMGICQMNSAVADLCVNILFLVDGWNGRQFNMSEMSLYLSKFPAGCSVRQPLHYAQAITTGKFRRYDFGREKNLKLYKRATPPDYNLSNIVAPMALFYSNNDWLIPIKGVRKFKSKLPNVPVFHFVKDKFFTHLDFMIAMNAVEQIFNPVLKFLESFKDN